MNQRDLRLMVRWLIHHPLDQGFSGVLGWVGCCMHSRMLSGVSPLSAKCSLCLPPVMTNKCPLGEQNSPPKVDKHIRGCNTQSNISTSCLVDCKNGIWVVELSKFGSRESQIQVNGIFEELLCVIIMSFRLFFNCLLLTYIFKLINQPGKDTVQVTFKQETCLSLDN